VHGLRLSDGGVRFGCDEHRKCYGCKLADDTDDFEFLINMMLDDKALLNMLSKMAIEYARTWDWSVRAPKILKEIDYALSCNR